MVKLLLEKKVCQLSVSVQEVDFDLTSEINSIKKGNNNFGGLASFLGKVRYSEDSGKELLYLGYWVNGCKEMDYKKKFNSSELLINDNWVKND